MVLVSISCITYNHAPYIKECLDGFLNQKCEFNYEILIHDDSSTDGTKEIIENYHKKFPNVIKPILQKENQWSKGVRGINIQFNFPRAKGKYIALCEGDDYWTDPYKLQKQVDFLEKNEDCNLVYHRVNIKDQEKNVIYPELLNTKKEVIKKNLSELALYGNFMHTPSVLFRNNLDFKQEYFKGNVGDYILWFMNGVKGNFGYLPDIMAVYRLSKNSTWGKKDFYFRANNWLHVIKTVKKISPSIDISNNLNKQAYNLVFSEDFEGVTIKQKLRLYLKLLKLEPRYIKKIICKYL